MTGSPIALKRPFAQVNVLVPTVNFADETASVTIYITAIEIAWECESDDGREVAYDVKGGIRTIPA